MAPSPRRVRRSRCSCGGCCFCALCPCQCRCPCLLRCVCLVSVSVRALVVVVVFVPCVRIHAGADDPLIPGGPVGSAGKGFICALGRIASNGLRQG